MNVPLCNYETHEHHFTDDFGLKHVDTIAIPLPCGHKHRYQDFEERLARFHPELRLGFDPQEGIWVVFRWNPETVHLESGLSYIHRFADPVYRVRWMFDRIGPNGGRKVWFEYRELGDWLFEHLGRFKGAQFGRQDASWIQQNLREKIEAGDEKRKKLVKGEVDSMVNEMMSFADAGNPRRRKTAVRCATKEEVAA